MTAPVPPPLHVFWDQDSIWVVAHDSDDAEHVYNEYIGDCDSFTTHGFVRFPDEQEIKCLVWVSGPDAWKIATVDVQDGTDAIQSLRQTARAWADQCGRGFLCTTDY